MNYFCTYHIIFFSSIALLASNPLTTHALTLSLQECYQRAVRQSERLGISREEIRAAEGRYQQAIATLVPKVVIRTGAQWQDRPIFAFGAEPKETSTSLSLWIRQPLFNGFREFHAASAGRAEIRRRIFDEVRARQELYIDIITLGRQILYYEKDLKLLAEMEQVLNRRVEDLKRRVELGQSRPGELLQSKSEVANLRVTTQRIQGFLHASRELMAFLIGLPASSWTLRDNWSWPRLEALEEYLKKTETRPDLLAAIEAERSARSLLKAKQAETYPSINIETHIYLYEDPKAPRDWNVFLSAALPIFDFIEIGGRVKEQKAALQQSRLSLERLRRTADQEVRTAFSNFNALVAQIVELREAERLAIENLKVQEEDYTLGRVTNLDVIDALRRKLDLQRQKISAETEALIEYERLHVAAGGSRL